MDQEAKRICDELVAYIAQAVRLAFFEGYTKAVNDGDSHSPLKAAKEAEEISMRLVDGFRVYTARYERGESSNAN